EPTIDYTFPILGGYTTVWGPVLPPDDIYTITVELVGNGFEVFEEGLVLGTARVPQTDGTHGLIGEDVGEWSYSFADGRARSNGQISNLGYFVSWALWQYRNVVDTTGSGDWLRK